MSSDVAEFPMELRFEIDTINKVSLVRVEGLLTDERLGILYEANRRHCNANHAQAGVVDLSCVREFALTTYCIQRLANQKPAVEDAKRLCLIVAPEDYVYGLSRMFQIMGEETRPSLQVVHTLNEAFATLGTQLTYFGPSVIGSTQRSIIGSTSRDFEATGV